MDGSDRTSEVTTFEVVNQTVAGLVVNGEIMNTPFGKIKLVKVIRGFLGRNAVDNEPTHNAETTPISSDWAYEHEAENDEDITRIKRLLKGIMNTLCDEDFEWDDFEDMDADDITELIKEHLK